MKIDNKPLVSIIMPAYNAESFITETINSVLDQTYDNWELIIVDDNSDDHTVSVVENCMDSRIRLLRNKSNCGVAQTRNTAIAEAKGEYVAFIDSDDIWEATKLERQLEAVADNSLVLCYTSYDFIAEDGTKVLKPYIVPTTTDFEHMLEENVIGCSSVLVSKSVLDAIDGPFDGKYYHEDYALWMELLNRNTDKQDLAELITVGIPDVLMHHRQVHTARSISKTKAAKERWRIYRDKLHMTWGMSVKYMAKYFINGVKKYSK